MNTCISSHGEYGEHAPLDDDFCCSWCGVFDEDAAVDSRVAVERDALLAKFEALADEWAADAGIEGYINLGEAEDAIRAVIKEARA